MRDLDPGASPVHFFGSEVRHARTAAGMTQAELGKITGYDGSEVSKIEAGLREPPLKFAEGCDRAFPNMNGWFTRFLAESPSWDGPFPPWFRPWVDLEKRATAIRWFEPLLVPGLCQVPDYARSVLGWGPDNGSALDDNVTARISRQGILEQAEPPELWVMLGEAVLGTCVGSADIMRKQVGHLAEMAQRPRVTIQVVPASAGAYGGLSGAFALATVESDTALYLETGVQGMTVHEPRLVTRAVTMFEHLRAEALNRAQTLELLSKAGEKWTT